jgi:small subunit ribosomal protein S6
MLLHLRASDWFCQHEREGFGGKRRVCEAGRSPHFNRPKGGKMNEYETVYILDPVMTDTDVQQSINKMGEIINRHSGYIFRSQNMGKKNLAYKIKKSSKGYYAFLDYCGDNTTVSEIERNLKLDEKVLRYLTVRLNKDVDIETRKRELVEEAERLEKAMAEAAAAAAAASVANSSFKDQTPGEVEHA